MEKLLSALLQPAYYNNNLRSKNNILTLWVGIFDNSEVELSALHSSQLHLKYKVNKSNSVTRRRLIDSQCNRAAVSTVLFASGGSFR